MNQTFLDNLQLAPGFYPLASLLTGAALYVLYRLFIRMRCRSRLAQAFLPLGMCPHDRRAVPPPDGMDETRDRHESSARCGTAHNVPASPCFSFHSMRGRACLNDCTPSFITHAKVNNP